MKFNSVGKRGLSLSGASSGLKLYKSGKRAINERINETKLLDSNLSNDLKVSTYELQMLKGEDEYEHIL